MGLFHSSSKEEKFINNEIKKLKNRQERSLRFAEYAAVLERCKMAFEQTISVERLNAMKRREQYISDREQKVAIHDAVVGLLAVQEAEFELGSLEACADLDKALGNLQKVLGRMYRINHYLSLNGKAVRNQLSMDFDDTNEPITFSDRAELVDERFVEKVIQGVPVMRALRETRGSNTNKASADDGIDFASEEAYENAINALKDDADLR